MVTTPANGQPKVNEIGPVSNAAEPDIVMTAPYIASIEVQGVSALLFHAWNNEAVAEKGQAAKGSKAKKSDNLESYIYRNEQREICIPGEYLRMAIVNAAKYRQDPRSPRKSAMDLYKAGLVSLTELASLGAGTWEFEDKRRVTVQRSAITRTRPAFHPGWKAQFDIQVMLPEYIPPSDLHEVLNNAGRLIGLADFRPTYGRFQVTHFQCV